MEDFNVKYIISEIKSSVFKNIYQGRSQTKDHKFAAHERIFRLVLNLSTLSLTGWVAIVAWKFEAFSLLKFGVYISCGGFILSLMFIALSDLFIMLQSRCEEIMYNDQNSGATNIFSHLESSLAKLISDGVTDYKSLYQHSHGFMEEHFKVLVESEETNVKKAIKYSNRSWVFGISGIGLFFVSIIFSLYTMTNFVQKAEQVITYSSPASQNKIVKKNNDKLDKK